MKHFKAQEKLKQELKEQIAYLTSAVLKKYQSLTEEEIRTMVFDDKWMPDMQSRLQALMATEHQNIITSITALNDRYKVTLPEMEGDLDRYRYIKRLLERNGC